MLQRPVAGRAGAPKQERRRAKDLALVGTHFIGTQLGGQLVEDAVDELVAIGGAKDLRQLDAFVDHHAVRHVDTMTQLVGRQAQDRQLNWVQLFQRTVEETGEGVIQLGLVLRNTVEDFPKVSAINADKIIVDAELGFNFVYRLTGQVPLIQGLHGQTARFAARSGLAFGRLFVGLGGMIEIAVKTHLASSCASRLTISRADSAASAPLLPALVPERSMACSMESTVSTPKATGTPNSMETWARPLVHSPATYSKCGVPPRITAPRAMIASNSLRWAIFCATRGISKAPGARMMVMSLSLTPWRTRVSTAPLTRLSTTKLLKRPTTRAKRPLGAIKVPSMVFRVMGILVSIKEQD